MTYQNNHYGRANRDKRAHAKMRAQTLRNRIEKLGKFRTNGVEALAFNAAMTALKGGQTITTTYIGRGRRTKTVMYHDETASILRALGIDFTFGNIAPRGGKGGNVITLTEKGKRQVADYQKELAAEKKAEALKEQAAKEQRLSRKAAISSYIATEVPADAWYRETYLKMREAKAIEGRATWQDLANRMVQSACKNDFSCITWREVYDAIKIALK